MYISACLFNNMLGVTFTHINYLPGRYFHTLINDKVKVIGPNGKEIEIKYKKLQQYLNQGYTQVS